MAQRQRPYGTGSNPIPERIITRPPSAELRPDQKDQDSLPPYEVLDAIVQRYMEEDQSPAEIIAAGYPQAAVDQVVRLIRFNEYKRRQSPVGIRVTHRSFGGTGATEHQPLPRLICLRPGPRQAAALSPAPAAAVVRDGCDGRLAQTAAAGSPPA